METIKTIIATGRNRDGTAVTSTERSTPYSYSEFCSDVWKVANLYSHYGVHHTGEVAIGEPTERDGQSPALHVQQILALFGGLAIGSRVSVPATNPVEGRLLVADVERIDSYRTEPQCSVLAYGGEPQRTDVGQFESATWSENAVEPPETVRPETVGLVIEGEEFTHDRIVRVAHSVTRQYGIDEESTVAIDTELTDASSIIAGLVAPLSVGATISLGIDSTVAEASRNYHHVVSGDVPQSNGVGHISIEAVSRIVRETSE